MGPPAARERGNFEPIRYWYNHLQMQARRPMSFYVRRLKTFTMKPIVVDNSVLIDILVEDEEKTNLARLVYDCIKSINAEIFLPIFALFEIKSALSNKKITKEKINLNQSLSKDNSLKFRYFPIDSDFVTSYLDSEIGYLKAADYVYVCLAHKENAILITEDKQQYKVSKKAMIETYKLSEFASKFC
jgi:predicted nucleic acid-binding protein